MKYRLTLMAIVLIATVSCSYGQADEADRLPLTADKSAVRYIELADSCSKAGDSINASQYYLKIDPFFFVSSDRTPATIDSSFVNYLLMREAIASYREIFVAAYTSDRTEAYEAFEMMCKEDQKVRRRLERCGDCLTCAVSERHLAKTDSTHFEKLHSYVSQNGWPDYRNGGMFAEIIAMHDYRYMAYYLPFIRKSVLSGNSSLNFYEGILNRAKPSDLKKLWSYERKRMFDISYVLDGTPASPAQVVTIQNVVLNYGPVKYQYFIFESAKEKDFKDFMRGRNNDDYWLAWSIIVDICRIQEKCAGRWRNIPFTFQHHKVEGSRKRLKMYLVY